MQAKALLEAKLRVCRNLDKAGILTQADSAKIQSSQGTWLDAEELRLCDIISATYRRMSHHHGCDTIASWLNSVDV